MLHPTPTRSSAGRPRLDALVSALGLSASVLLAACGTSSATATPSAAVPATLSPAPSLGLAAASPAPTRPAALPNASPAGSAVSSGGPDGSPSAPGSPPAPGSPAPPVTIDEALAALLPTTVDGIAVQRATETEAAARSSATLGADAEGFAAVEVLSADGSDLAIASVVRLRPTTPADGFFASWRPSFDQAACAPAGGVSSTEIRTIGGRSVDATLCVEGATVYHVRLDDGRIVVSVLEAGTKGYGRALLEGAKG